MGNSSEVLKDEQKVMKTQKCCQALDFKVRDSQYHTTIQR